MAATRGDKLNLIFDADDTLWHSNLHFREVEREFAAAMAAQGVEIDPRAVRPAVRRFELEVIRSHGYGRGPYVRAMHLALDLLVPPATAARMRPVVDEIGARFIARDCELIPGVGETLAILATRHRLLLFTKGQRNEQLDKLRRSGLAPLFSRVEVPAEKDVAAYLQLVEAAALDPRASYMIGNSPRSDINPALRAGLGAVYIPQPEAWEHDHDELDRTERLIELASFLQLLEIF
ncbi:MAG TPA: HAD family hydrolase [Candidatus Binataceae bacterium]|nr:HAD family hydrolase [Candidatus Binataceae bacterium]